jgi:hypothetical protein
VSSRSLFLLATIATLDTISELTTLYLLTVTAAPARRCVSSTLRGAKHRHAETLLGNGLRPSNAISVQLPIAVARGARNLPQTFQLVELRCKRSRRITLDDMAPDYRERPGQDHYQVQVSIVAAAVGPAE